MAELILFGIVNLLAAVLSGASGIGGAIISTPFMILLGLSPAQAIATAKFGGLGITLGASGRFFKEKLTDKRTVLIFSALGAVASLIGSLTVVQFQEHADTFQKLIGFAILVIGVPALYFRKLGLETRETSRQLKAVGLVLFTIGVFIQVALSAGLGTLQVMTLMYCFGMTALVANATRRTMQLAVALVSLAVFIPSGLIDYRYGIVSMVTAFIGGWIGAHIAVKKGNKFIVNLFAVVSALLALQLLLS